MSLTLKKAVIVVLSLLFLASLVFVQATEVVRREREAGLREPHVVVPASSEQCVSCHAQSSPGIVQQWKGSTHGEKGVGCVACHQADPRDPDSFTHYGEVIATIVTPLDCSRCHTTEFDEFEQSHHAKAGNILASLDNRLAEVVEGARVPFAPHGESNGRNALVNGRASVETGCMQCHGSKVALLSAEGGTLTIDDFAPDADGFPTNAVAVANIQRNDDGKPMLASGTWPNTGIGRMNLDGSLGSCSACHSRHDFSPRRARQPESCGKCHLGPDHPQKEIYEESKHGIAFRDLKDEMNLDAENWVLGEDYSQAPTCATCHMSGNTRNGGKTTHDPGERISWTNRPPISLRMDTDAEHGIVTETDPAARKLAIADTWQQKRQRMKDTCLHCHTPDYVNAFYAQYDDFVELYNEKFAIPGKAIMDTLWETELISRAQFDDEIEWTWFYLWHHEGRRARHGASMMAPDYAHWHVMFEVGERFYVELIPQARELAAHATEAGDEAAGAAIDEVLDAILARPEHVWSQAE